jgi:hypothetical protein
MTVVDRIPQSGQNLSQNGHGLATQGRLDHSRRDSRRGGLERSVLESLASRFVLEAPGRWQSAVARPANAVRLSMASGALESEFHVHREAQLMYLVRGELICEGSNALWIVPPQSALWVPAAVTHRIRARAPLDGYSVFLEPDAAPNLPADCCAVSVTPLFRELLLRLATRPARDDLDGPDARLVGVLLDELATVAVEKASASASAP